MKRLCKYMNFFKKHSISKKKEIIFSKSNRKPQGGGHPHQYLSVAFKERSSPLIYNDFHRSSLRVLYGFEKNSYKTAWETGGADQGGCGVPTARGIFVNGCFWHGHGLAIAIQRDKDKGYMEWPSDSDSAAIAS